MAARSYLYVPGDSPGKLAKAFERGADAVILDLEDAVAPAAKEHARGLVAGVLREGRASFVRVNNLNLAADIDGVINAALLGVVVPKATPAILGEVNDLLDQAEAKAGLEPASVRTIPLIETAAGVLAAPELAGMSRVLRLGLGEADLAADLGLKPGPDRAELLSIRIHVVVASAAAGITAPIGPVDLTASTTDDLSASTRRLLSLGFRARTAIHPRQVTTINEVFVPTPDEVAAARQTLAVFDESLRQGSGVGVLPDGRMVDLAVVRSAREILDRWEAGPGRSR